MKKRLFIIWLLTIGYGFVAIGQKTSSTAVMTIRATVVQSNPMNIDYDSVKVSSYISFKETDSVAVIVKSHTTDSELFMDSRTGRFYIEPKDINRITIIYN
jgi:hypothetical protein